MLFNSFTFVIFFAVVLFLHSLPLSWRARKFNLLIASYLFYAAWNPPFIVLVWISTLVDWYAGKYLYRTESVAARRALLAFSLTANLGLLGFFKYAGFLVDTFCGLAALAGIHYQPPPFDIVLPVGISFYTFQTLSYTFDIYRRRTKPCESFLDYALFVTFFPQLVAGPIVRSVDFLPQCVEPRRANRQQLGWGLSLVVLGLFEKVVVADGLMAPVANKVYGAAHAATAADAWLGTFAFSGQIFCDFAGYSACAIGCALCLGFAIQDNFRFPYAAIGFSDFWERWHISLSSWLRDYLYISLGGSRKGRGRTFVNLVVTMFLGGLWHGAAWTFVVWGLLHGFYLVAEHWLRGLVGGARMWRTRGARIALGLLTYLCVCYAWTFFRGRTFDNALALSGRMLGLAASPAESLLNASERLLVVAVVSAILLIHWILRDSSVEEAAGRLPWWMRVAVLGGFLAAIVTMSGDSNAFIYFQF
ncbi:MAG: MBOAT family protein [Candidatus Hydrogenedentes bacterium]|nr:MBOAT family protein [Candidatus Hydrogenedentota bacterium]